MSCVGLDLEKYTNDSWNCDDCQLFEHFQNTQILKPKIEDNELLALPKEIVFVNQQYKNVYRELIVNFLIAYGGRIDNSARSLWLSIWFQEGPSVLLSNL